MTKKYRRHQSPRTEQEHTAIIRQIQWYPGRSVREWSRNAHSTQAAVRAVMAELGMVTKESEK